MRVLVPVNSSAEMMALNPFEYNTEFYCGYMPSWWLERYGSSGSLKRGTLSSPINNRNGAATNVVRADELKEMVAMANRFKTSLFLAINAKHYPGFLYSDLEEYIYEIHDLGIRKVIVCDEGLMQFLSGHYPDIKISVSCLNQVTNTWSARRMLNKGNIERVVFPRHMASHEIVSIASAVPEIDFEFFIFSNKCVYDDGHCRGIHEFTPICQDRLKARHPIWDADRGRQAYESFVEYCSLEEDYESKGIRCPNFSCAACLLPRIEGQSNVVSAKIAFRGHDLEKRLWMVRLARCLLDSKKDSYAIQHLVCSTYGAARLCESGMACMC